MFCQQLRQIPAEEIEKDAGLKKQQRRFKAVEKVIEEDIPELRKTNKRIEADIARLKARLSEEIKGREVFLGFAATAEGDIVSTPIDSSTNGVMCHAQVLNSILQNRFIAKSPRWLDLVVFLLLGAIASAITATRGPRVALISTLLIIAAYVGVDSLVLFRRYDVWMPIVPVVFTVFLAWAFVTLFRQLTAERDKRLFRKQLSQYTSPAIAAKIAESPDAARAFKQVQTRDMTCFFSDLAGFTSITEREDAEVVQYVLNTYLERMCQVIWSAHGLVSKFMGDGIMAFFNSSVDPLPGHPGIACEAALQTFESLERLKREQADHSACHVFKQLKMRVGIAAGSCKNGDLGSELKADYTIIGDVVNLAARLEPANKVFGTQIMISGPVYQEVRDGYECRYLAELQVKGKRRTVPAYEIVGRKGGISEQRRSYIERFEAGVELYKARRWGDCIAHFTKMLSRDPHDPGAACYIRACQEFKRFPPAEDWNGALELKEK